MAAMMMQLADRGCHNINFVTPTHVVPQLLEAVVLAAEHGLRLPIVYNSSGYDKKETLEILDGIIDIYMPDFKFWDEKWSERFCEAQDYREVAVTAIKEMHRQVGELIMDGQGIAQKGLLVRHLVMPNNTAGTPHILKFIAKEISTSTYVNVMDQYRPCGNAHEDEFINQPLTVRAFKEAIETAKRMGLRRIDPRDRIRLVFGV
jgi:putative pyruvate formate lyase activating enzyme